MKDTRDTKKKSQTIRYHECQGFGQIRVESPNYKKTLGNATNMLLTDDKSSSGNKSKISNSEKCLNYISFCFYS